MAAMPLSPRRDEGIDLACGRKERSGSAPSSSGHSVWQRFKVYQSLPPSSKTTLWRHPPRDDFMSEMIPSTHFGGLFGGPPSTSGAPPGPALGLIRTRLPTSSPALVSTSSAALPSSMMSMAKPASAALPEGRFFRGGPAGLGFALGSFALDDLDARPCGITSI